MKITEKKYIENIESFAEKNGIEFDQEGECGFGRECVGLLKDGNYIDYNPTDSNYEYIPEFHDERLWDITPEDAYHKHTCLAVLGRGEDALRQLSDWVDSLNELGATVCSYKTGATGMQALFSGTTGNAIKLPKP